MFAFSVDRAADREVKLLESFRNSIKVQRDDTDLTHQPRTTSSFEHPERHREDPRHQLVEPAALSDDNSPHIITGEMLSIAPDVTLLEEVKDIRDELRILRLILDDQYRVLSDVHRTFQDVLPQPDIWAAGKFEEQISAWQQDKGEVESMLQQVDQIHDSVFSLLDLKQKHANAVEAHSARIQADSSAEQGRTIMVFTIVTVVFLPLSFIAAFFAINITDLPHNAQNEQEMSLEYASKYIFGIGIGTAAACMLMGKFHSALWNGCKGLLRWLVQCFDKVLASSRREPKQFQRAGTRVSPIDTMYHGALA
jgi:Mg2+ and Co2+ transporter CorA